MSKFDGIELPRSCCLQPQESVEKRSFQTTRRMRLSTQKISCVFPPNLLFLSGVQDSSISTVDLRISVWTTDVGVIALRCFGCTILSGSEVSNDGEGQADKLRSNDAVFLQPEVDIDAIV